MLRIDKGSLGGAPLLGIYAFINMRVVIIHYIYYERSYFSLFNDIFDILIDRKL